MPLTFSPTQTVDVLVNWRSWSSLVFCVHASRSLKCSPLVTSTRGFFRFTRNLCISLVGLLQVLTLSARPSSTSLSSSRSRLTDDRTALLHRQLEAWSSPRTREGIAFDLPSPPSALKLLLGTLERCWPSVHILLQLGGLEGGSLDKGHQR